ASCPAKDQSRPISILHPSEGSSPRSCRPRISARREQALSWPGRATDAARTAVPGVPSGVSSRTLLPYEPIETHTATRWAHRDRGRGIMIRLRIVAGVLVAVAVAGCYSPGAASATESGRTDKATAADKVVAYWTTARLLSARAWRVGLTGAAQMADVSPSAHTTLAAPRVGALFTREGSGNHFCTASVVSSPGRDLLITAAHCINGGDGRGYRSDVVFIPGYQNGTVRQSTRQLKFSCDGFTGGTSGSPWITRFDPYTRTGRIVGVLGGYQQGGYTADISYSAYFGDAIKQLYQQASSG